MRLVVKVLMILLLFITPVFGVEIYLVPNTGRFSTNKDFKIYLNLNSGEKVNTLELKIYKTDNFEIFDERNGNIFSKFIKKDEKYLVNGKENEFYYYIFSTFGSKEISKGGTLMRFKIYPKNSTGSEVEIKFNCKKGIFRDSNALVMSGGKIVDILNSCKGGQFDIFVSNNFDTAKQPALVTHTKEVFSGDLLTGKIKEIVKSGKVIEYKNIEEKKQGNSVIKKFLLTFKQVIEDLSEKVLKLLRFLGRLF